jgi:hypothetical protein
MRVEKELVSHMANWPRWMVPEKAKRTRKAELAGREGR